MKNLAIILAAILLSSCTTLNKCNRKFPPQIRTDSIYITKTVVKLKDTTIYIHLKGDTVFKTDTVTVNKNGVIVSNKLESDLKLSYASAWIENNKLQLLHYAKDTVINQIIENAIRESSKVTEITKTETIIKEVNILKGWQKVLMWFGGALILGIVIKIASIFI